MFKMNRKVETITFIKKSIVCRVLKYKNNEKTLLGILKAIRLKFLYS